MPFRIFAKLTQTFPDFQLTLHELYNFPVTLKSMQSSPNLSATCQLVLQLLQAKQATRGKGKEEPSLFFPAPSNRVSFHVRSHVNSCDSPK